MSHNVLYIAGVPRSGSTILGKILGQSDETAYVGELWDLRSQLQNDGTCGCNRSLSDCPYWSTSGIRDLDLATFDEVAHSLRVRDLLFGEREITSDTTAVTEVYRELKDLFGASVIVDTTKFPSYLNVLDRTPELEVKVLHLVRDPRAVVYSWWRRPLKDKEKEPGMLDILSNFRYRRNPVRWGLVWTEWNYLLQQIWGGTENYFLLRYEDFCQSPRDTLRQALVELGVEYSPKWRNSREINLSTQHSVKGNPGRFKTGRVRIEERTEWRDKMGTLTRLLTTVLALPQLHRYGYQTELFE